MSATLSLTRQPEPLPITGSQTTGPSFLTLPLEIRQLIYTHLFTNTSVRPFLHIADTISPAFSILLTNKQCNHEARRLLYNNTTFHLRLGLSILILNADTKPSITFKEIDPFGANKPHVHHIAYYPGGVSDTEVITNIHVLFPNLRTLWISLGSDFFHSDQTSFDRAMKHALRYGEWKCAVKTALDERFGPGMRDAVVRLQRRGLTRGFAVVLHWRMAYRFVEFKGDVDLDEWVLRIWDPDGVSKRIYEIKQNPMELTWCEGRLTLPSVPFNNNHNGNGIGFLA